jgi:hypothetical protein
MSLRTIHTLTTNQKIHRDHIHKPLKTANTSYLQITIYLQHMRPFHQAASTTTYFHILEIYMVF